MALLDSSGFQFDVISIGLVCLIFPRTYIEVPGDSILPLGYYWLFPIEIALISTLLVLLTPAVRFLAIYIPLNADDTLPETIIAPPLLDVISPFAVIESLVAVIAPLYIPYLEDVIDPPTYIADDVLASVSVFSSFTSPPTYMVALPPLPVISFATIIPQPAVADILPLICIQPTVISELVPVQLKVAIACSCWVYYC